MSITLSNAIGQVRLNPSINNMVIVKLFQVDSATPKGQKDYSTKVTARTTLNALLQTQNTGEVVAFNIEIMAHATGVARHKVLNICANNTIPTQSIHDIAALHFPVERRNAVADLVLKELARAQFSIIQSEINSGKNYDDLYNNKAFQEWYYSFSRPLHPGTEGLTDHFKLVEASFQMVHSGYIEITTYLLNLVEEEYKARFKQVA